MKINIRQHHQAYLNQIATQMECTPAIALDYLLFELRKMNYQFCTQLPVQPQTKNNVGFDMTPYHEPQIEPSTQTENNSYSLAIQALDMPVDEAIQRLLNAGLESF